MHRKDHDEGVLTALIERFENQRLPRARRLREKVNNGNTLSEDDLEYLSKLMKDTHKTIPLIDRNPKYQKLAVQALELHKEIVEKALENEKNVI